MLLPVIYVTDNEEHPSGTGMAYSC